MQKHCLASSNYEVMNFGILVSSIEFTGFLKNVALGFKIVQHAHADIIYLNHVSVPLLAFRIP